MPARTSPVDHHTLTADRATLKAILRLSDYQPINSAYSIATIQQLEESLIQAELEEARLQELFDQARAALEQGREVRMNTSLAIHNLALGVKAQVIAQYGDDSYAVKAVGLTRKSDRKRPSRKKAAA
ncbi:MAG: hypothetical protein WCI67_22500 [Chloroflexales bacterium]